MDISIKTTLLKRKMKQDGTIPIYIRFTQNRKSTYLSTGLHVHPKHWNKAERLVRKSHPQYRLYNQQIKDKILEIETEYLQRDRNEQLDHKKLKEIVKPESSNNLFDLLNAYHTHVKEQKRFYESKKIGTVIENLRAFQKGKDMTLAKLTPAFASEFQDYLLHDVGNNAKTTKRKISTFKAFLSWLIEKGELEVDPFTKIKIVRPLSSEKTRLNIEQIDAIRHLDLKPNSLLWHTRNFFMYSFYNAGIRFGDLCSLKWANIVDGRLLYKMHKTGGIKSIKQGKEQESILKHYRPDIPKPDDYIFPILKKKHTDAVELRREISSRNAVVNKNLKIIAEKAGIQANVSFHVARHSFSQYALKKGVDLYSISKALGHSDLKITEEYLNSFDEDLLDNSMDKLFGD